ncbi:MAG: hypothetical protein KDA76_18850, partial [Planctomycetaceae bacterium]|nr:hypothetical protein [Planctomycetaceae bacterium]
AVVTIGILPVRKRSHKPLSSEARRATVSRPGGGMARKLTSGCAIEHAAPLAGNNQQKIRTFPEPHGHESANRVGALPPPW